MHILPHISAPRINSVIQIEYKFTYTHIQQVYKSLYLGTLCLSSTGQKVPNFGIRPCLMNRDIYAFGEYLVQNYLYSIDFVK